MDDVGGVAIFYADRKTVGRLRAHEGAMTGELVVLSG
jgi:hypothetical protein